jgi:hypothetical protein
MSGSWENEIRNIASGLLTLEINVALKPGMVAQKMPELPVALHVVIETYAQALTRAGTPITHQLLRASAAHLVGQVKIDLLENWYTAPRPAGWERDDSLAGTLSNGAETFEAMQWAAFGALRGSGTPPQPNDVPSQAALMRVRTNSRQLRAAAIMLEQQFSSGEAAARMDRKARKEADIAEPDAAGYTQRLGAIAQGGPANAEPRRLFGGTLEQTAAALFKHPRPIINVAPDLTLLVRKAWDVGLEEVVFQTSLQLDGDTVVRMSDQIRPEYREFLRDLHQQAVRDGTAQWKLLFQTLGELLRDTGKLLAGVISGG